MFSPFGLECSVLCALETRRRSKYPNSPAGNCHQSPDTGCAVIILTRHDGVPKSCASIFDVVNAISGVI